MISTTACIHQTEKVPFLYAGQAAEIQADYGWIWIAGNKFPHFTVTGSIWLPGDKCDDPSCGGAIHEEIVHAFPWLRLLVQLHLADATSGEPMYAVENGWYWFKADDAAKYAAFPAGWEQLDGADRAGRYLGCDPALFFGVTGKDEFARRVATLEPAWKSLRDAAFALYQLEEPELDGSAPETSSVRSKLMQTAAELWDDGVDADPEYLRGMAEVIAYGTWCDSSDDEDRYGLPGDLSEELLRQLGVEAEARKRNR